MTREHLLLELAGVRELGAHDPVPADCDYDFELGAWVVTGTSDLLVERPDRPRPSTKKKDVETGEDLKGT